MSFKKQAIKGDVPSARSQTSIALVKNLVYVFGGSNSTEAFDDLYTLNIDTWTFTKVDAKGAVPSKRWGHTLTAIPGNRLLLFGGETIGAKKLNELYVLDTDTLTWSKPDQTGVTPTPRCNHTATVIGDRLFVYGGDGVEDQENALVILNITKMDWSIPPQQGQEGAPEPRKGHTAAAYGNRFLVYGGYGTRIFEYFDDLWVLDLDKYIWLKAKRKGPVPEPRGGAQSFVFGSNFFVWGGYGAGPHDWNEVHYLDVKELTWLKRKGMGAVPSERLNHAVTPLKENSLLIFGGQTVSKTYFNEVYVLSTSLIY